MPRRLLDVRLSTIARPAFVVVIAAAYVGSVLLLFKILSYWWNIPNYYYGIAFVLAPLRYFISWLRDRKQSPKTSVSGK